MKLISSEYDEATRITLEYWMHPGGKKVTIRRVQDIEPILLNNVAEYNAKSSKSRIGPECEGLGRKVASIPAILAEKWIQEGGINILTCPIEELKKLLNDPEYRKLRTTPGRI
jgi:hypothetical protein